MNELKLDIYMKNPEIINEPMPLREIHAIRAFIYDDIKNMTCEEINNYYMSSFNEIKKKYNIKTAVIKI